MFKNFGTVFKFTFRNQVQPKSFKALTIVIGILLFLIPVAVLVLTSAFNDKEKEKKLESCGADKIIVVNEVAENTSLDLMKMVDGEGYANITYTYEKTVADALAAVKASGETKTFVLHITKSDAEELRTEIILPSGSDITSSQAENYNTAISKMNMVFVILARGIQMEDMTELMKDFSSDIFNVSGWAKGESLMKDKNIETDQNNETILDVFTMIITMLVVIVMYFVVLLYGASITKNIVMEKSSKLMDTMLISVKPEAMIFGKLTGVLAAGLMQLAIWIVMIVLGVIVGVQLSDHFFPGSDNMILVFVKSFGKLNLFQPIPVIVALVVLVFGILMYSSLAAFAGAISSTQEQAASNQGIFVLVLVVAYIIVIMKGMDGSTTPEWIYLCPPTAALTLPAGLVLGTVNSVTAAIGSALIVVLALLLVVFAGKVYKMMALYKGDKVNVGTVFKMMTNKQK